MTNRVTSWVRTVVPGLWATLLAWFVSRGLPAEFAGLFDGLADDLLVPAALALFYAAIRWVESRLPAWLARLLLGSARTPTYPGGR